jgi:hypothetical protein
MPPGGSGFKRKNLKNLKEKESKRGNKRKPEMYLNG